MNTIERYITARSCMFFKQTPNRLRRSCTAFTFLELIAVLGLLLILAAFAAPALNGVKDALSLTDATADIASLLEQSRAYAMANRTFVWVGLKEVDASQDASVVPQADGIGRVAVLIVASRDGTRGYDVYNPEESWSAAYQKTKGRNLVIINKLVRFENLHMAASLGLTPEKGPMGLEAGRQDVGRFYRLGHPECKSLTPFNFPLESKPDHSNAQYRFSKVVNFDPNGIARIQYASNNDEIKEWMEIGLEQTNGASLPEETFDPSRGKKSAIQIDCMTGLVRIYRP